MPPKSLIDPASASNAGGVAGRRGQKYQDHVAASFVIEMLDAPALLQVECETADDITVRWIIDGAKVNEYVQVKTTDGEQKWTVTELTTRTAAKAGTSIAERSLACDAYDEEPLFRLVTELAEVCYPYPSSYDPRTGTLPAFDADALVAHCGQDKKAEGGTLTFVLVRAIGDAFVAKDVDRAELRAFLVEEGAV